MNHLAPDRTGATLELPEKLLCCGGEFNSGSKEPEGKAAHWLFALPGLL
jgi:hypothetical protein